MDKLELCWCCDFKATSQTKFIHLGKIMMAFKACVANLQFKHMLSSEDT